MVSWNLCFVPDRVPHSVSGDNISARNFLVLTQATRASWDSNNREGSQTTHVAQTGYFSRGHETTIEAKIGAVARGEPITPAKLFETKDRRLACQP